MKNLRERWHGLTVLGVVAFAAACMTVAPAPSFADIAGGGGGGGPITEWCSDGRPKTGLVRCEDGNLRYFDPETGAMVTNQWHNEYEAVWYYFGADGIAVSGWQSIGGDKYYFYPESHDMAYGRVQIDGKNYFLNTPSNVAIASVESGVDAQRESTFAVEQNSQVDNETPSEVSNQIIWHQGWISPEEGAGFWRWGLSDGTIAVSSWRHIDGSWYWFDDEGRMAQDGLVQVGGATYAFSSSGAMRVGWYLDSTGSTSAWRYFSGSGAMVKGWLSDGSNWYWLDDEGKMVHDAMLQIGGATYGFSSSGAMLIGWHLDASVWHYFSGSGALVKGWLSDGGRWYWLDPADGSMATGLNECNGTSYIFNSSGAMLSSQWALIDNNWYYADSNGLLHGGWLLLGNSWYYLDPGSHIMLTGFVQVGSSTYFLTSSGAMATGWALADGTWYYAASNGAIQRGRWIKSGSAWYYLDDVSGAMRTGEFAVGSKRYFSYDSGAMASSCWIKLNDGMAWANSSGALSEPLPTSSDGSPVVADRTDSSSLPGVIHIGDAVFYADANGVVNVASGWIMSKDASDESGNTWYYASSNGVLKSGWQYVNGAWYWMDPSTFKMKTGWLNDGGTWYWLQPSGAMFANGWLKIDGVDYYFNASGAWLNTSGSVLGVNRSSLVNWLMSHENDGYYRGTRYDTHLSQETCMYPKGDPRWDGYTGMNCGGFVSHAYMKAGGNLAPIAAEQSHSPWSGGPGRGGCVNAYRWYGYAIDTCANVTYFNSIDELLRSGLARKGDIVFFNPYNPYADDSHIGFFWGNSPSENLFWHSDGYGNRISGLTALGPSKVILIR